MPILFAEISPEGWVLIITAVSASVIVPIINLIITLHGNRRAAEDREVVKEDLKTQNAVAAEKVEGVKRALNHATVQTDEKLAGIADVAGKTHTLVNSNFGAQLKLHSVVTRRLANLTNDPDDVKAADLAERLLGEHENKQHTVDSAQN